MRNGSKRADPDDAVLYFEGDPCSPKYVAGALQASGFAVEVVTAAYPARVREAGVILLSDVHLTDLTSAAAREIERLVREGMGLIAVGGWKSFGAGGYAGSAIADALPVTIEAGDDRSNVPGGAWLRAAGDHPLTHGLPLHEPPVITGFNRIVPRAEGRVAIEADVKGHPERIVPVLVTGQHGAGRVVACATDLAPHWSGGLTDWGGEPRDVGEGEELGWAYIELLRRIVLWAGGTDDRPEARASRERAAWRAR